jgi:predicted phosphodiesterase
MKTLTWLAVMFCLACTAEAGEGPRKGGDTKFGGGDGDPRAVFLPDIPEYPGNVILARPTDRSITANVMLNRAAKARIVYGAEGSPEQQTDVFELKPGETREIVLGSLPPDSACRYRLVNADADIAMSVDGCSGTFHTRRPPDSSFTFTVQADSHLDGFCLPELYTRTLSNALACKPDFHIDLGDTFMTGKIATRKDAAKQYLAQRYCLGLIGPSAPVFMVIGNHDGEEIGRKGADEDDILAVWSCKQRKHYFTNPVPDGFYTGNTETNQHAGQLQNYYAWEWGNALFVVLDPYWYSRGNQGGSAPWNMTIGKPQYDWLARTLRQSHAGFKFIFIHQLVGGLDRGGRGGSEAAPLFEWGGHEKDGTDTFAANRPGWEKPIHKLLMETGVSAVFHGHDHFFAHQQLDGIVYQLVPQPAHRNFKTHQAEDYGYLQGEFFPNSGFLSVRVTPNSATVDYVRTGRAMDQQTGKAGSVACRYAIAAKQRGGRP